MATQDSNNPFPFRDLLSRRITQFVLWGTLIIAAIGIGFAVVALTVGEERAKSAFTILQYVFGALLPLWGTWIGTILAYYYSKENFESANRSVQQLVDKVTSEKKLQSVKAKDVMIPKEKLIYQTMSTGEDLTKFKLKDNCLDEVASKGIKRVIILNEKDNALYVIHRDLISFFIAQETIAKRPVEDSTLKDMLEKGSDDIKQTMKNSVKFIGEEANLLEAKNLMQQYKTCQDVFITKNGNPNEPILGWITNVTISENSIV